MRSEIGKLTLDNLFKERATLNRKIVATIQSDAGDWGINAHRYEIKDIKAPTAIQKSMMLQSESERRKRADILASEGERQAEINISEA